MGGRTGREFSFCGGDQKMTMIVTLLYGAGLLLAVSAINNCSIVKTFQNIINNQPINGC